MVSLQLVVRLCGLIAAVNSVKIIKYTSLDPPKILINDGDTNEFFVGDTAAANLSPYASDVKEPFELIQEKGLKMVTVTECVNFSLKSFSVDQNGNIQEERREYQCQPELKPPTTGMMMTTNVKQDQIIECSSSDLPKVLINDRDTYEFSVGGTAWANLSPSFSDVREPFQLIQDKGLKMVTVYKCLNFSLKTISTGQDGNIKEMRTEYRCQPDEETHVKPLVIGLSVGAVVLICLVGMLWMFRSSICRPAPDPH